MTGICATLIQELHRFAKNNQFQQAVIGLSGGLTSSLVFLLATRVFGPKNVTALLLPETGLTPAEDIEHAKTFANHFGSPWHYQPINNFLVDYNFVSWDKNDFTNENLKTRIRANLILSYAETANAMVLGTACKSDLLLGLGLPEGEFIGLIHPLGDLYKTDIKVLAQLLGMPNELIEKSPSRHLKPHQTDKDDLGAEWNKIDEILKQLADGFDPEFLIQKGMDPLLIRKIARLMDKNKNILPITPVIPIVHLPDTIRQACEAEASS